MKIRFRRAYHATLIVALAAVALSCNGPTTPVKENPEPTIPPGKGAITVSLPGNLSKVLDVAFAAANSSYFEVVAYEQTGDGTAGDRYWAVFENGVTTGTINGVNPGTYKVIVLAGLKVEAGTAAGSPSAFLLGTGKSTGIVVSAATNTPVAVTLINSLFGFSSIADADPNMPGNQVAVGQSFSFTVAGNTGIPEVVPSVGGLASWNVAGATLQSSTLAQAWSATFLFTAPVAVGTGAYHFAYGGGRFALFDQINGISLSSIADLDGAAFGAPLWRIPSSVETEWAPFEAQVPGKVTFDFFSPGLDVEITWGAGQ